MLNGRFVLNALTYLKSDVTENELLNYFNLSNDESKSHVQEIHRILDNGVNIGLIVRNGNKYGLPSLQNMYETDACEARSEGEDHLRRLFESSDDEESQKAKTNLNFFEVLPYFNSDDDDHQKCSQPPAIVSSTIRRQGPSRIHIKVQQPVQAAERPPVKCIIQDNQGMSVTIETVTRKRTLDTAEGCALKKIRQ